MPFRSRPTEAVVARGCGHIRIRPSHVHRGTAGTSAHLLPPQWWARDHWRGASWLVPEAAGPSAGLNKAGWVVLCGYGSVVVCAQLEHGAHRSLIWGPPLGGVA